MEYLAGSGMPPLPAYGYINHPSWVRPTLDPYAQT
jgi:hypothetical protein